jgi:hypothetical protein
VKDANAHAAADPKSVTALAALDEALVALGELHWSRGEPDAIDDFHGCVAANESRISLAPDDASGHVALVRSLATVAEWNTQQGDADWALAYLERAVAASARVGQLRSTGRPLPERAELSLAALQRSLEAFARLVDTGPLRPGTAVKVTAFFEKLGRR